MDEALKSGTGKAWADGFARLMKGELDPNALAHAVIDAGAVPVLLVAVVDRGGTVEAMAAAEGIPFRALLTAPDRGFDYEGG